MGEAVLYNKNTVADKQYDWNKAFNNEDFVDYVLNAIPIDYIGLEEFISAYEYKNRKNFLTASFPNCWMDIGSHAFENCVRMTSITCPSYKYESSGGVYNIYSIGEYAFKNCNELQKVTISTARHIGSHAFENLSNLLMFNSVYSDYSSNILINIYDYAFANCCSLSMFNGYKYINTISDYAFYNCGLSTCNIGESICSKIGSHAFEKCSSLIYVNRLNYNGVASSIFIDIGEYAFKDCISLYSFNATAIGFIGSHAFENCISLYTFVSYDGLLPWCRGIGEYAFSGCSNIYRFNLNPARNFTCDIYDYAFANCINLNQIAINNISHIGKNIFENTKMYSVTLYGKDSNSYIPSDTFVNASSLDTVILYSFYSLSNYAFYNLSTLRTFNGNDINYIGSHAFDGCSSISQIMLNTSFYSGVYCDEYAFNNCGCRTVTAGFNYIGNYAFNECNNVQYVQGPPYVKYIGKYAFYKCSNLTNLFIFSTNLSYIGSHAFDGCLSMTSINLSMVSSVPILESIDAFDNIPNYTIYVLSDIYQDYINDSIWCLLSNHIISA